jgi:hypothetical protein
VGASVHVPGCAISVAPTLALPVIVGLDVLLGTAMTAAVGRDVWDAEPPSLLAVTVTASAAP